MELVHESYEKSYLPSNIRLLRKQKNWSQVELAEKVGLNRGNIASYENGTAEPKICNLLKMAHLFGVNILTLIQTDLSAPNAVYHSFHLDLNTIPSDMFEYIDRAQELQSVINGLNICCRYKFKSITGELSPEIQLIALNFEELYKAAQTILDQHLTLLHDLKPRPSNPDQHHSS